MGNGGGVAEESTTASKAEALTKSIEELKKLFGLLAGDDGKDGDEKGSGGEVPGKPERGGDDVSAANEIIRAQVRRADESFRATIKWMVGAVAGVALVVFGSGPFLIDRNPFAERDIWVLGGIAAVAAGVALVVYASSRVTEPEDASLGELVLSFRHLDAQRQLFPGKRRSLEHLRSILSGTERSAHLGPGLDSVNDLIAKLASLQEKSLSTERQLAQAMARHDATKSRVDGLRGQLADLDEQIKELLDVEPRETTPGRAAESGHHISALLATRMESRRQVLGNLAVAERILFEHESSLTTAQVMVAGIDAEQKVYDFHRTLVISEAWIAEKRGLFRGARRFLVLGALLAFVGGTAYLSGVSDDDPDDNGGGTSDSAEESGRTLFLPATVTVQSSAAVAKLLPDDCLGTPLDARFESLEVPEPGTAFTVQVVEEGCEGGLNITKGDAERSGSTAPVELVILQP